jgi:hypothetical protein
MMQAKVPNDVIADAQTPPAEWAGYKEILQIGCGEETLIKSSANSVLERLINSEDDTCELDFSSDEFEDADSKGKRKKIKCRADDSGQSSKDKTEKL